MTPTNKVRVWDLPTRLFHWLLAACIVGAFVTVKAGGLWMEYHLLFGYATLALVLFRLVWGVVGPQTARFTHFVRGPGTLLTYLRGKSPRRPGHNPLGAFSVVAMLLLLGYQATIGLFASDDILTQGPLSGLVSGELVSTLTSLHHLNEWPIIALVAVHVLAIIWYRVAKRQKLAAAMMTGDAPVEEFEGMPEPTRDDAKVRLTALVVALAAAGVVYWITTLEPAPLY